MRHLHLTLLAALLLGGSCNSDQTCQSASDCPAGYTCAFLVSTCVYNPPADLTGTVDGSAPADLAPAPDLTTPVPRFTSGAAASFTIGAGMMKAPAAVCVGGGSLYVSDSGNNRVLVYAMVPGQWTLSGAIGQPDTVSTSPATGAAGLSQPTGLWCDGTSLIVADTGNNRVLYFAANPTTRSAADGVVGQPDLLSGGINRAGSPAANSLDGARGVFYDGARLYVADSGNYRVLGFPAATKDALRSGAGLAADVVLGQQNTTAHSKPTLPTATGLSYPVALSLLSGRLAVVDQDFNRVAVFPVPVSATQGLAADAVVGQSGLQYSSIGVSAASMSAPLGIFAAAGEFFVADAGNNRVLVFTAPLPATGGQGLAAAAVLGQASFAAPRQPAGSGQADLGKGPGGVALASISGTSYLFVADTGNNRVQVFVGQ